MVRSWTRLSVISLQQTISCLSSSKQDSQMPEGESAYLISVIVKIKRTIPRQILKKDGRLWSSKNYFFICDIIKIWGNSFFPVINVPFKIRSAPKLKQVGWSSNRWEPSPDPARAIPELSDFLTGRRPSSSSPSSFASQERRSSGWSSSAKRDGGVSSVRHHRVIRHFGQTF